MEDLNQQEENIIEVDKNININKINNIPNKDSMNNNTEKDNNDNEKEKILPLEIVDDKVKRKSEGEVVVDILKNNEKSLMPFKKTDTKKSVSLYEDNKSKSGCLNCFKNIPTDILKIITILVIIMYMITGIIAIVFFAKNRKEKPFLFCFNFLTRDADNDYGRKIDDYNRIIFASDLNSFCILQAILLFLLIILLYTLLTNKNNNGKDFLKNFSIYFPLALLFNIPIFILGILSSIEGDNYWQSIIYIIFTLLSSLCMLRIYITKKKRKYKNLIRVVNQSFLSGLLSAYQLYCFMYNICYISTWWSENTNVKLEIIPGIFYFIISFLTITIFNDIFFSVTALIIQIGLLYVKKKDSMAVVIFNITIVVLSFVSILVIIVRQNKNVFNIVIEGEGKKNGKE